MNEDIKLGTRIKIFIWSISIYPIWNFLRAKVRLSVLFLALLFISSVGFILNHFSILPISLKFISSIYLLISLFVAYILIILKEKWIARDYISYWRKEHKILNPQEISKLAQENKNESNQLNQEPLSEDKTPRRD